MTVDSQTSVDGMKFSKELYSFGELPCSCIYFNLEDFRKRFMLHKSQENHRNISKLKKQFAFSIDSR